MGTVFYQNSNNETVIVDIEELIADSRLLDRIKPALEYFNRSEKRGLQLDLIDGWFCVECDGRKTDHSHDFNHKEYCPIGRLYRICEIVFSSAPTSESEDTNG
jgi:hypothetical protein